MGNILSKWIGNYSLLNYSYVDGLFALGARTDFERYGLAFVERLETLFHDARKVDKNLLAVLRRNESVAFFAIEPFYLACHKKIIYKLIKCICKVN